MELSNVNVHGHLSFPSNLPDDLINMILDFLLYDDPNIYQWHTNIRSGRRSLRTRKATPTYTSFKKVQSSHFGNIDTLCTINRSCYNLCLKYIRSHFLFETGLQSNSSNDTSQARDRATLRQLWTPNKWKLFNKYFNPLKFNNSSETIFKLINQIRKKKFNFNETIELNIHCKGIPLSCFNPRTRIDFGVEILYPPKFYKNIKNNKLKNDRKRGKKTRIDKNITNANDNVSGVVNNVTLQRQNKIAEKITNTTTGNGDIKVKRKRVRNKTKNKNKHKNKNKCDEKKRFDENQKQKQKEKYELKQMEMENNDDEKFDSFIDILLDCNLKDLQRYGIKTSGNECSIIQHKYKQLFKLNGNNHSAPKIGFLVSDDEFEEICEMKRVKQRILANPQLNRQYTNNINLASLNDWKMKNHFVCSNIYNIHKTNNNDNKEKENDSISNVNEKKYDPQFWICQTLLVLIKENIVKQKYGLIDIISSHSLASYHHIIL